MQLEVSPRRFSLELQLPGQQAGGHGGHGGNGRRNHRVVRGPKQSEILLSQRQQIESHAGKPALLKLSAAFQDRYKIAAKVDRNLWLTRTRFQPDYAGRPWTLWTANRALETEAGDKPLHWVVVQP